MIRVWQAPDDSDEIRVQYDGEEIQELDGYGRVREVSYVPAGWIELIPKES